MSKETTFEKNQPIRDGDYIPMGKKIILGMQHTFTMFGATVLVPLITGLDISVALFMAGIGTLFFHFVTKKKVPVFLGSSFAFIAPMLMVSEMYGMQFVQGGIVVAGLTYVLLAGLVYAFGHEKIVEYFPPIVTGPIIMIIGLKLAPTAIDMASQNWLLALVSLLIVVGISIYAKGFLQVLPVLCGLVGGYVFAAVTGNVDFTPIKEAALFGLPNFTFPKFNLESIMIIAPIAVATVVEHIGNILVVGTTVEDDYIKTPGLHRTLLGDGIATSLSAFFGGPANTTYAENTGVLALTKIYHPVIMRIAACFAIILGVMPKLGAVISTIPTSIVGGISIVLFGMIASVGGRSLVENQVDFTSSRNLIIAAVIFVIGLGGAILPVEIGTVKFTLESMALAAIAGILLNKVLPKD
ncbi:uracil-xanthine permease family protein [Alkaliphilus oremlandii]|uniref:Uracil-xanthine permease n=1 Tax=Alkaliphilus oremlandii (strain OhILAs) TaxID=350688 RepID=A8MET7_ALKOO|nr:solute carrier family 23 protein [Alkaliphilus oremlandii]ABW18416.1 uracil-xanthine permease [Alkaliphilus oremlandii OhILAs]